MSRHEPFAIEGPAVVRFSGGRTSAYMLWRILAAHGGVLPPDVHVVFSNTGKERPETLDFVRECGRRWQVPIRWVEWRLIRLDRPRAAPLPRWLRAITGEGRFAPTWTETFAEVSHDTASRNGEPFEALVRWKQYLPNPIQRICTQHLKIEAMKLFALGALGLDSWTSIIGIRADEPKRFGIIGPSKRNAREEVEAPLVDAGATEPDVMRFWAEQSFDLDLEPDEGNCDLCFLKGKKKIQKLMRRRPSLAPWWIGMEEHGYGKTPGGAVFRANRPGYASMLAEVRRLPMLPGFDAPDEDALIDCACTD